MAISFFTLLSNVSALEFKLNSPENIDVNESFSVTIEAQTSDIYDVKIFAADSDEKIISEIYNDGWKNPRYYLKSAFPGQSEFKIHILREGDYLICARLRKTEKTNFDEQCNNITVNFADSANVEIKNNEKNAKIEKDDEETNVEKSNDADKIENVKNKTVEKSNYSYQELTTEKIESYDDEKIVLNPAKLEEKENSVFITKYEKQRLLILYGFSALCIVIIILLALKKL